MYSGQWIAFLLFNLVQTDEFILDNLYCTNMCKQNNYNLVEYSSSIINYCTDEDIPNNVSFVVKTDKNNSNRNFLKIEFAPPKKECGLRVALIVNASIKNQRECEEYKFEVNDINSNIHTEKVLCILRNTNQFIKYNDNSTAPCKDNIDLWFRNIFTGCYALGFHIDKTKYIIKDHTFLNTTYQRTEVTEPQFTCKYDTYYNLDQRQIYEMTNFTLDTSLPEDIELLEVILISPDTKIPGKGCEWHGEPKIINENINLIENANTRKAGNCNIKLIENETIKTVQCNFHVQTAQTANYCFVFQVGDYRCRKNTMWQQSDTNFPCTWIKSCTNTSLLYKYRGEPTINPNKLLGTNLNLLLPIIIIVLIVSTIIGILCFRHLCIRKKEITLYINPQYDDFTNSACFESTNLNIIDNDSEKEIDHDNLSYNNIILLYTKSSISFMALMKDFRETLAKICSCSVYDWYDETEWNNVAKVGPVPWFTKLLNGKCRVVWVDTPTTRSIVILRKNDSSSNKFVNNYEIGDFRDVEFPVVLELAKCNDAVDQYRRHFVVRFEGLENMANMNDPFLDLSPHARYRMPQHLAQLCLDLSMVKPLISKYQLKAEENILQQHLRLIKMESII